MLLYSTYRYPYPQWFSVTLCYYGLSFASTSLAGDKYSNYMLSVFVEIPGQPPTNARLRDNPRKMFRNPQATSSA